MRTQSRVLRIAGQLLIWPSLGAVIIAFDELAPALATSLGATAARGQAPAIYYFVQWGLLTPFVVLLARRLPLSQHRFRNATLHALAAVVVALARAVGDPARLTAIATGVPPERYLGQAIGRDLLVYASIALVVNAWMRSRNRVAAERAAIHANARVAEAERTLLEQRVAPQLIIESLDELSRRVRAEPDRVQPLIECFSAFLRARLTADGPPTSASEAALRSELQEGPGEAP